MADINKATLYVLRNEDEKMTGKVTTDRGGMTRYGIAQKYHPNLDPSYYTCPALYALAQAQQLYKSEYGQPLYIGSITSQAFANKLLDLSVKCGAHEAQELAQKVAVSLGATIAIDGHMGPASVAAINKIPESSLITKLIDLAQAYYRRVALIDHASPNELASWLTRAAKPGV